MFSQWFSSPSGEPAIDATQSAITAASVNLMAKKRTQSMDGIHERILGVLRAHPDGVDIGQIRLGTGVKPTEHQHLDRRVRYLCANYEIDRVREGGRFLYRAVGSAPRRQQPLQRALGRRLRAKILERDGRRCQMCGRTVSEDHVKLQVDHKLPKAWGGTDDEENLWALCVPCNHGKRDYFESFDPELMADVLSHEFVHERICYLLKSQIGEWVDSDLIGFVANFNDYQDDWKKRLRECRYFGLEIEAKRKKVDRRTKSFYRLANWCELPEHPTQFARQYEKDRAKKNRS